MKITGSLAYHSSPTYRESQERFQKKKIEMKQMSYSHNTQESALVRKLCETNMH